jgi:transcriptional regulator with XRE-family HTH domain
LIPQWDLPDRMAKSLRTANVAVQEMADYLDVHRNTVGGWLHGRIHPDVRTLRLWAMRTGVSYDWLLHGEAPAPPPGRPAGVGKRRRAQRLAGPASQSVARHIRQLSPRRHVAAVESAA